MMNDEIFDKVFALHDREVFNDFLLGYKSKIIEETLCLLPQIIISLTIKTKGLEKAYVAFFEKHPELVKRKDQVSNIVMALELEDGSRSLEEILKLVPAKLDSLATLQSITPVEVEDARSNQNGYI